MKRARGYTIVEVMIAMAVLGVGTSGVIAMQKVAAVGNREARTLALATQIARGWIDRLRSDAVTWNQPSNNGANLVSDLQTDTVWLRNVTNVQWFRPDRADRGSPAADAFGNDLPDGDPNAVFCTNLRLAWLYGSATSTQPPLAIRAEVRVFWLRDGAGGDVNPGPFCSPAMNAGAVSEAADRFHFVYLTSAILENVAQ